MEKIEGASNIYTCTEQLRTNTCCSLDLSSIPSTLVRQLTIYFGFSSRWSYTLFWHLQTSGTFSHRHIQTKINPEKLWGHLIFKSYKISDYRMTCNTLFWKKIQYIIQTSHASLNTHQLFKKIVDVIAGEREQKYEMSPLFFGILLQIACVSCCCHKCLITTWKCNSAHN